MKLSGEQKGEGYEYDLLAIELAVALGRWITFCLVSKSSNLIYGANPDELAQCPAVET
jgi:hypothetical protein